MIKNVMVFSNGSCGVRYESGKFSSFSKNKMPKTVMNWIMCEATVAHDFIDGSIFYTRSECHV